MSDTHQIYIMRKDNRTFVSICNCPLMEVYAMLYGAISTVAQNTNQSFDDTLGMLSELHRHVKFTDQD